MRLLILPLAFAAALAAAPAPAARPVQTGAPPDTTTPAAWLALLPDGETKRRFILDCAGCHSFDARQTQLGDRARTREEWSAAVSTMLLFAGAHTGFPIMAPDREAAGTGAWLEEALGDRTPPSRSAPAVPEGWEVRAYPLPRPDLPHDVAVAHDGRVVVTGMLTGVLYTLDPESGAWETIAIPVPQANPRAIEIGSDGAWWVVLGDPGIVTRYDPESGEWRQWNVGVYAHEVAIDSAGRVWYNAHFSKAPEIIGVIEPTDGSMRTFEVPSPPMADGGSTIPYGLRAAPDGTIWMTQLLGNRLVRFDPTAESFRLYDLPTPHSGPRRLDIDAGGGVWVPEFSNGHLARFDPVGARFTEYAVPTKDALPYVARVDASGAVWLGTGAGDLVARFDPESGTFLEFPLPAGSPLVRHLAIDPHSGDVWGATSPFPIIAPQVFRIRAR